MITVTEKAAQKTNTKAVQDVLNDVPNDYKKYRSN